MVRGQYGALAAYPSQGDAVGALLFVVFLGYLFKGRSPMVYLAAFFITTWLELLDRHRRWHMEMGGDRPCFSFAPRVTRLAVLRLGIAWWMPSP